MGLLGGAVAAWFVASSNHLQYAAPFALLEAVQVWSSVAIGLLYRRRRPESPLGTLLLAYGFFNALIGLEGLSQPPATSVGAVAEVPAVILIAYLILVYRRPTLGRGGGLVLAAWSALVIVEYTMVFLAVPTVVPPTPLAACAPHCPANPLFVPAAARLIVPYLPWLDPAYRISIFVLLGSVFAIYLPRLRRSLPERQVMLPVLAIFSVWLLSSTLYGLAQLTSTESQLVFWALYLGRLIFPFSFVAGLLAAQSFSGEALTAVLANEAGGDSIESTALARALRDPGITVVSWDPTEERFVDSRGRAVSPPSLGSSRVMTRLSRDGRLIGAIVSDVALTQYPELLEAAGRAVTMAIENRRLKAELERSQASLERSQAETADAAEVQRRIERDLHDSVQQELLAAEARLQIVSGLVADQAVMERLTAINRDIELAAEHVRNIGHGVPGAGQLLAGLGAALHDVASRAARPVVVRQYGVARFPEAIEEAVFFCCTEALQNALKHGRSVEHIRIDLIGSARSLTFYVVDDGAGFDPAATSQGVGLRNMTERMRAIGGWLAIHSGSGRGTTISGGATFADPRERR